MEDQTLGRKGRAEHSLNVKELFFKYVKFLPLYIICVALALFGAYMYLRYATETYRSAGQLIVRDEQPSNASAGDRLEQAMQRDSRKSIQTEIEVIQSRPLMERTVEVLGLNLSYYSIGKIKELNVYKQIPFRLEVVSLVDSNAGFTFNLKFVDQQRFRVNDSEPVAFNQTFQNPNGTFRLVRIKPGTVQAEMKIVYTPTSAMAGGLVGGLAVVPKQGTGILTLAMETTSPQLSADVVNALMNVYQQFTIDEKNASVRKSLDFIDDNLKDRQREIDSITQKLVAYQKVNNIINPETQASNYFQRVESAFGQEQQQRMRLNNAVRIQDYLRSNAENTVPSSLGIEDPTLNGFVEAYNKAQLERKDLLQNAQPGHVMVREKTEEVEALRRKMLENISNIQSAYNGAIGTLRSASGEAVAQIREMPTKQQEMFDIQNQLEGKLKLYNQLLSNREVSAITLASTISNNKILQQALPNATPVKPERRSIQLMAVFIGLLLPTVVIVVIELLNDKVRSRSDIEKMTDATILAEVGHSYGGNTLVVTTGNRKVIAEQFRILRSNLQYLLTKAPKPVIMVTSSFSGEGKSFISTNVGAVMALASKKTVILEFDIRKPKIISGLKLPKSAGLTNYILGEARPEELPVKVPGYDNLYVIPCGPVPPNPAELLLDTKLDELFDYLKQTFDVVVMDTAPVGMVSDAMTLSRFADCTLYIVRQGHTYKKQISLVDTYYYEGKLPKVSLVLNDVKVQAGYGSYGYSGGYGYGYGYGSGYFEDEAKEPRGVNKWFGWLGHKNGTAVKKRRHPKKA